MFRKSRQSAKDKDSLNRLTIEQSIRSALERNEFTLHYQPLIDSTSWRVTGTEALLRWQHPLLGTLPPAHFIPLAEETGLIVPIGEWVLRTACNQLRSWQRDGLGDLYLAVNISARQFHQPEPAETILAVLHDAGLDPKWLTVELTESSLISNSLSVDKAIRRLNEFGVKLALDDFGKGFSSFEYLTRLPLDVLKIDESLVRNVATNADDAAVLAIIIDLGHKLRLKVIAEGLETEDQLKVLGRLRCHAMQGYIFSRPLPAEQFRTWVKNAESKLGILPTYFKEQSGVERQSVAVADPSIHQALAQLAHG